MIKNAIAIVTLLVSSTGFLAAEEVEITGTYELQVACADNYHEEISFVVEPGKDKFSGIRHAISLTAEQKEQLRSGSTKIKIKGQKKAAVTKKMTKGAVRMAMYNHIKNPGGIPLHNKQMSEILGKIAVEPAVKGGAHDHGDLKLKKVEDDEEIIEVAIMEHVLVKSIEILK